MQLKSTKVRSGEYRYDRLGQSATVRLDQDEDKAASRWQVFLNSEWDETFVTKRDARSHAICLIGGDA